MKIALAGYGQEGESSYRYWNLLGADITIFDEKQPALDIPDGAKTYFAPDAFSKMNGFDIVIRTAGLSPHKISSDSKIWSATNEFFKLCPAEIVGVTGTKGKGTTATLIAEILKNSGKTVHLLGNIGVPALSVLATIKPTDTVVFELSSFQLWDLEHSPQTAVVLMIEADHMDVHTSMEQYVAAKANIGKYQEPEDLLVYHPENTYSAEVAASSPAHKRRYMCSEGAYIDSVGASAASFGEVGASNIIVEDSVVCRVDEAGLLGAHNLENICAAITAAWNYTHDISAIKAAVTSFKGLPHRLEVVGIVGGVSYIDDSFSSAPGATVAAIKSFTQPEVLICGGFDRGLDYSVMAEEIAEQQNIKKVLLMGQTAQGIAKLLDTHGFDKYEIMDSNFSQIVQTAAESSEPGDVVLLSPGCASFDMFKDFKDRGEQFKKLVEEL